jgi:hypothetical protein
LTEETPASTGQLSPDGYWWWNGTQWVSAVSPDGRWRWDGERWVVNEVATRTYGPVRYEPTPDTRKLQVVVTAYLLVALVFGAVSLPFTIHPSIDAALRNSSSTVDPATIDAIVSAALVVAIVFAVLWQGLLILGTWMLWRWIYYVLMILGGLGAFTIFSDSLALGGVGTSAVLPKWSLSLSAVLALVNLGLAIWMFVLWRRHQSAWARRAIPI